MNAEQWARLSKDLDCGLRRGAWYRTVSVGTSEVALAVHGQTRSVARGSLEIVASRPTRWTIVSNARNAAVIPARWARGYAVCPSCRMRQLPMGRPRRLRCEGCNGLFDVAWDEPYLSRFGDSHHLPRM